MFSARQVNPARLGPNKFRSWRITFHSGSKRNIALFTTCKQDEQARPRFPTDFFFFTLVVSAIRPFYYGNGWVFTCKYLILHVKPSLGSFAFQRRGSVTRDRAAFLLRSGIFNFTT